MDEKLWDEFYELFTRTGVLARLAEGCGPYIGRMSNEDREAVLEIALGSAWLGIGEFKPTEGSVLSYWDDCLRLAVDTRMVWQLRYGARWISTPADQIAPVYDWE